MNTAVAPARAPHTTNPPRWEMVSRVAHQHTIARDLAHKRRLENVYVTSLSQASAHGEFLFGAFVPQSNVYINDMRAHPGDVTLSIVEIGRQIGIALSHEFLAVQPRNAFVLDRMVFEALPALDQQNWRANETLWGHATISQQTYSADGELAGAQADGAFHVLDDCVCTQSSSWSIIPRERYQRLREISRARNARRVGQGEPVSFGPGFQVSIDTRLRQPVLEPVLWVSSSGTRFTATLRVDPQNLFFFDHDNDHVPGMLVLEGMRAMALDIVGKFRHAGSPPPSLRRIEVAFKNFAELDAPVHLVATITAPQGSGPLGVRIEAQQLDRVFAVGDFLSA